jgi:hypothetical protein
MTRLQALFIALLLGYPFGVGPIRGVWKDHWLVKDGQQGVAVVTKEHWAGHNAVVYQYRVGQHVYTGQDRRSSQNPQYAHVGPGGKTVMYFSSSHPWLSAIDRPGRVGIPGLPVLLLVWLLVAGLIATAINPNGRWAFNLSGPRKAGVATQAQLESGGFLRSPMRLLACGFLLVLAMIAIEAGVDTLFGGK